MTIREQLRGALTNVLSNASNYPEKVQTRILGQNMRPITDQATDAVSAVLSNLPGDASDGHHTFAELYEYRMLYNAHAAHGWLAAGIPVVKSWRHSDGELCFGGGWFVVTATLSTGQVSNHYSAEHWDLFAVPPVNLPPAYDGHTPADAAGRLRGAAVFEQAHSHVLAKFESSEQAHREAAPTGDEREALEAINRALTRHWPGPATEKALHDAAVLARRALLRRPAQAEPTDETVGRAMNALDAYYRSQGHEVNLESLDYQAMRAALRAAFATNQEENRG